MKRLLNAPCVLVLALLAAPSAHAQQEGELEVAPPIARPTSGEPSLSSGRTLGVGEVMIAAAAGWPGIWAQVELAPTSELSIGVRGAVLYGSPVMALEAGVGGELSVPMRLHVFGEGEIDVAIFATPALTVAEAAAVGEGGSVYSGDLGVSSRLEWGATMGWRATDGLTLVVGAGAHFGFVYTPSAGDPEPVGALFARFGVEGLLSRDTMLFALAEGGVGFAPSRGAGNPVFREPYPPLFRVSLGIAYLM